MKLKEKYISIIVVLLAIGGGVLIFYFRDWKGFGPTQQPSASKNIDYSKPSERATLIVKNTLLAKALFSFPDVATATQIPSAQDLPDEFGVFIPADNTNLQLKIVNYTDGKKGYLLSYLIDQDLFDFFTLQSRTLNSNKNFKIINSIRANIFGLMELENDDYQVRMEYELTSVDKTSIVINILSK